eukprot:TRINITY_DN26339_c0_g1_i1.p1 TRINITY_DN26339_c0_g1~~TRINITY_DN26339_c0_g1_i1.p1  ORF type:complete len:282 (-),score=38.65 TRINITY_DN26339_c0_g1_i1:174-986(-)
MSYSDDGQSEPVGGSFLDTFVQPENVRHNSCFLVPRPHDASGSGWLPPDRPLLSQFRYHDMVSDTIYAKSSKDMHRLERHLALAKEREEERLKWSNERFRSKREAAILIADMRETFQEVLHPEQHAASQALASSTMLEPLDAASVMQAAPTHDGNHHITSSPLPLPRKKKPARSSGLFAPAETAPPGTLSRSASEPNKKKTNPLGPKDVVPIGKGCSEGIVWPGGWVPRQFPGSRGLPGNFQPAIATNRGNLMYPHDRCLRSNGTKVVRH